MRHVQHEELQDVHTWVADTAIGTKGLIPTLHSRIYTGLGNRELLSIIFMILFCKDNDRPALIEKEFYQLRKFITPEDDLKCYLCEHNAHFVASYNLGLDDLICHFLAEDSNFDTQTFEAKKITKKDEALPNYLKFLPFLSKQSANESKLWRIVMLHSFDSFFLTTVPRGGIFQTICLNPMLGTLDLNKERTSIPPRIEVLFYATSYLRRILSIGFPFASSSTSLSK